MQIIILSRAYGIYCPIWLWRWLSSDCLHPLSCESSGCLHLSSGHENFGCTNPLLGCVTSPVLHIHQCGCEYSGCPHPSSGFENFLCSHLSPGCENSLCPHLSPGYENSGGPHLSPGCAIIFFADMDRYWLSGLQIQGLPLWGSSAVCIPATLLVVWICCFFNSFAHEFFLNLSLVTEHLIYSFAKNHEVVLLGSKRRWASCMTFH